MRPSRLVVSVLVGLCLLALTGFGCRRQQAGSPEDLKRSLVVWGLWQESKDMEPILKAWQAKTGIAVEYKKIASVATYERELVNALAEGRGPDVFVIANTWVESKRGILSPAPLEVADPRAVQDEFVDVVAFDVVRAGRVYALPTSVDTLQLYYNKDILNSAGVARPPETWQDMQRAVEKITKVSRLGTIEQSALSLGTAANVNRAGDILQLLMLQSGLPIVDAKGDVDIANDVGERALVFYTDFANKAKKVYTWDLAQDFSVDAFAAGKTAMMLNYSYHLPTVRAKNPRLTFGLAAVPQIADSAQSAKVNFAGYWPFAVAAATPSPQAAWQFVRFLTSREQAAALNAAQRVPPARKDSVLDVERDSELGVFAEGTLTAKSWVRQDVAATDEIFATMIDSVVKGEAAPAEALKRAEDQLKQLRTNENP